MPLLLSAPIVYAPHSGADKREHEDAARNKTADSEKKFSHKPLHVIIKSGSGVGLAPVK